MEGTNREYKLKPDDKHKYLKDVVAFLNTTGGEIYFGYDDLGHNIGFTDSEIDDIYEQVKNTITHSILPDICNNIMFQELDNNSFMVIVSNVTQHKPYYIKKYGRSQSGCFKRVGPSSEPMREIEISEYMQKYRPLNLASTKAFHNKYTHHRLEDYYKRELNINLTDIKKLNLKLIDRDEDFTKLGELFADENGVMIIYSKFSGNDKVSDLVFTKDVGYTLLSDSFNHVLKLIDDENIGYVKSIDIKRQEVFSFDKKAIRELVINAFVHNDYMIGNPQFTMFKDFLEIKSFGGLLPGMSKEAFYKGSSKPRNPELVSIFRSMNITESVGRGIPDVLEVYSKDIFTFLDDQLIIRVPKRNEVNYLDNDNKNNNLKFKDNKLNEIFKYSNEVTSFEIVDNLNCSIRVAQKMLKDLYQQGVIKRRKEGRNYIYYID